MSVNVGSKLVGSGQPVFIVLEAGPTHSGLDSACALVDVAANAGADAIKFQTLDADALVPDRDLLFEYGWLKNRETGEIEMVSESLWKILKRRELSSDEWRELIGYCKSKNVCFFSTATTIEELDFLAELNCDMIKICSGDLTYHHFLRESAKYDWAVQIDTGGSTLAEVEQAIDVIEKSGCKKIIINHCPSGYPAHLESINLRVVETLQHIYSDYPIAFSDHSTGWDMDVAAVALGANLVEKTITLDRTLRSPEHVMSLEPQDVVAFVQTIRDVEVALGSPRRTMGEEEREKRLITRRSLHAARGLSVGHILEQEDLAYCRPGDGIPANLDTKVLGKKVVKAVAKGDRLFFSDFD